MGTACHSNPRRVGDARLTDAAPRVRGATNGLHAPSITPSHLCEPTCLVLATTRADVNGLVRRHLGVRKISFASMDDAVGHTGMEYGGITPLGLPGDWPILIDRAVAESPRVVVGSGVRGSKLWLPGAILAALPGAQVLDGLGKPIEPVAPTEPVE